MLPIKKILCSTDFSEPSHLGIEAANELAMNYSAELLIISVIIPLYPVGAPGIPPAYKVENHYEEMEQYTSRKMEQLEKEKISTGVKVQKFIAHGNAADEIVKRAEREKVDLIVIATHGWTGWRRFIFGSVTEKVLRLATCPVLVIPEPK